MKRNHKNRMRKARRYDAGKYRELLADMAVQRPVDFLVEAAASITTTRETRCIGGLIKDIEDQDTRRQCESLLRHVIGKMQVSGARR